MAKKDSQNLPSEAEIQQYEMLEKLLTSIYGEFKEFSKKNPDKLLNKFKIKNVNRVLEPIKEIMKRESVNAFLELLDADSLPSNSDAILVIGQFNAAMKQFRSEYYFLDDTWDSIWSTKENPVNSDDV